MSNYTILLIDYDPRSTEQLSSSLAGAGYRVEVAEDGLAGIEAFSRVRPHLTLIEAMIPKKHGFEVCQELKRTSHGRQSAIVIMTAVYKGRKYRQNALHDYGCDEYLEKPFSDKLLLETVRKFCPAGEAPAAPDPEPEPAAARDEPTAAPDLEPTAQAVESEESDPFIAGDDQAECEISERLDEMMIGSGPAAPAEPREPVGSAAGPFELTDLVEEVSREVDEVVGDEEEERVERDNDLVGAAAEALAGFDADALFGERGDQGSDDANELPTADAEASRPDAAFVVVDEPSGQEMVRLVEEGAMAVDPPEREAAGDAPAQDATTGARGGLPLWVWALAAAGVAAGVIGFVSLRKPAVLAQVETSSPPLLNAVTTPAEPPLPATAPFGPEESSPPNDPPGAPLPLNGATTGPEALRAITPPVEPPPAPPVREAPARKAPATKKPAPKESKPEPLEAEPAPPKQTPKPKPQPKPQPKPEPIEDSRSVEPAVEPPPTPTQPSPLPATTPPATARPDPIEIAAIDPEPLEPIDTPQPAPEPSTAPVETPAPPPVAPLAVPEPEERVYWKGMLLDLAEVDSAPVPVRRDAPDYPVASRQAGVHGTVELKVLVGYTGKVDEVRLLNGVSNLLDRAAIEAVERWTYEPAFKNGLPVKVWLTEKISYSL